MNVHKNVLLITLSRLSKMEHTGRHPRWNLRQLRREYQLLGFVRNAGEGILPGYRGFDEYR